MPETTVGAIITHGEHAPEHILLTRRNTEPFQGRWCLPGGHIDRYETALEAIVREVREETGLRFQPQFYGYFDEILHAEGIHNVVLIYVGPAHGKLSPQPEEVSEIGWFTFAASRALPLAFGHNEILDNYAEHAPREGQ